MNCDGERGPWVGSERGVCVVRTCNMYSSCRVLIVEIILHLCKACDLGSSFIYNLWPSGRLLTATPSGCAAHVSFAVQTPAQTLGLAPKSPACRAIHKRVQAAAAADAASAAWRDAVWLAVYDARARSSRVVEGDAGSVTIGSPPIASTAALCANS